MKLVVNNLVPGFNESIRCNTCLKLQDDCVCKCSFCGRLRNNIKGKRLISNGDPAHMICHECAVEAKELARELVK